jgi:2-keto-3-deoxy-L-fuconate dehydrogenase
MFELVGKRAVITGGASGIGLAMARLFASQGASIVLLDQHKDAAQEAAISISSQSSDEPPVLALACDVSDETSVNQAVAAIPGSIDILVNCAGVSHVGSLLTTTSEDLDRLYRVNVRGTALCMRAAVTRMQQASRGVILNMCSIAATAGLSDRFAYSMTKGAVLSMTLSVAKDYLAMGIRCNCISPARVHTPFVDGFLARNYPGKEAAQMEVLARSQPIGRMGHPDEIAALALYLCSDEASFISGVDYPIDGGFFNLR